MRTVARLSNDDRADVIRIAAADAGLPDAVMEKDYWVCYALDHLFRGCDFKDHLVFKGGTSLSKAYGLIDRFSEDIDLIIDWRLLGYGIDEPWDIRTNSKQDRFNKETVERTDTFLAEEFVPKLKASMSADLGYEVNIRPAEEAETVIFEYPRVYHSNATLDIIRLEIGPLAAWTPTERISIRPYLAEQRPQLFSTPQTETITVRPERTFWEKATILHQEANRPSEKPMPSRYSRHYYDMYQMGHSFVKDRASADTGLLERVVAFKEKFYRTPWAHLAGAAPGTLKLAPPDFRIPELRRDYAAMQEMITGARPSLEEIVAYMADLEDEINGDGI